MSDLGTFQTAMMVTAILSYSGGHWGGGTVAVVLLVIGTLGSK